MKTTTLTEWVQLITTIGVVIGLGLVVFELRQSHQLARTEATTATYSDLIAVQLETLGEDFATTFAKACTEPHNLTDAELLQMRAYRNVQLIVARRLQLHQDYDWKRGAEGPMRRWLYTPVGRAQVESMSDANPDIQAVAEQLLSREATTPLADCATELARTREILRQAVRP